MSRLPPLAAEDMTDAQRQMCVEIISSRGSVEGRTTPIADATGGLTGPFAAWVLRDHIGLHAARLGAAVRFESELTDAERELVVLCVASFWRCSYEWEAHCEIARRAGISEEAQATIWVGTVPAALSPRAAIVSTLTFELLRSHRIDNAMYGEANDLLGESALLDAISIIGYYSLVAITLNAFNITTDVGHSSELGEL